MDSKAKSSAGMTTYYVIYVGILAIAALQVVFAYQHTEGAAMLARMLVLAIIQAGLGVMFFMHLRDEKRGLLLALIPATVFVLMMMNVIWSDSFRLIHMRAFPN